MAMTKDMLANVTATTFRYYDSTDIVCTDVAHCHAAECLNHALPLDTLSGDGVPWWTWQK